LLNQIEFGRNNADDAQTAQTLPVSPSQADPQDQYGSQPDHPNVSNMTMENTDLDFIRSLAGIRK
jgi:hypothetical protein